MAKEDFIASPTNQLILQVDENQKEKKRDKKSNKKRNKKKSKEEAIQDKPTAEATDD